MQDHGHIRDISPQYPIRAFWGGVSERRVYDVVMFARLIQTPLSADDAASEFA